MMVIAVAVMISGPLAAATVWSPGSYGLEHGSVSWPFQTVSANQEVVQLGGTTGQASVQEQTVAAMQLGNNSSQVSSQEQTAATVQLGSGGGQLSLQAPASGGVQLSGYYDNMGSYTNIFYPSIMLGGTFSSSGGSGSCCGG
jgi:hypothetical protein